MRTHSAGNNGDPQIWETAKICEVFYPHSLCSSSADSPASLESTPAAVSSLTFHPYNALPNVCTLFSVSAVDPPTDPT